MSELITLIASSTAERAQLIDAVLCKLIRKGAELGELDRAAAVGIDGDYQEIKLPPQVWLDRLAAAIRRGALDRLTLDQMVDRILTTATPAE